MTRAETTVRPDPEWAFRASLISTILGNVRVGHHPTAISKIDQQVDRRTEFFAWKEEH
jgi:hypothetical protein